MASTEDERRALFKRMETDKALEARIKGVPMPTSAASSSRMDAYEPPAPEADVASHLTAACIAAVRGCLLSAQHGIDVAQAGLRQLQPVIGKSTRAGFLRTLPELIGPPPEKHWQEEWTALTIAFIADQEIGKEVLKLAEDERHEYINSSPIYSIEAILRDADGLINKLVVEQRWDQRHAEAYTLLYPLRAPLSRALAERRDTFAASTYALSEALAASAVQGEPLVTSLYKHLDGPNGLIESDAAWAKLLVPDRTGFRGLTSSALVVATRDPRCFTLAGFRNGETDDDGTVQYEPTEGDVVCIESAPSDATTLHAAVMIDANNGALPPNTLYRLKRVVPAGEWAVPGVALHDKAGAAKAFKSSRGGPATPLVGGPSEVEAEVRPRQRLLVVSCTFRPPRVGSSLPAGKRNGRPKLCGSVHTLTYASREAFIAGFDDILAQPSLSLAQEFERDMRFVDWRGVEFGLRDEWQYVLGPALPKQMGAGIRDERHAGMRPDDFRSLINGFIRGRRERARTEPPAGTEGYDPALLMLPEEQAYLSLDEVLAVRLYSGPAFQPINEFLRQLGRLTSDFRLELARHPRLTFATTVGLICSAIRKLSAVATADEAARPLFRGVRGELPRSFWHEDKQGLISAVDTAFMSTSKNEQTPVDYMSGAHNVLWSLHPQAQSDAAYHRGADISLISQFVNEEEVLFPPCCMMIVQRPPASVRPGDSPKGRMAARPASGEHAHRSQQSFSVTFPQRDFLGLAFKAHPPPPASPRFVYVDDVVPDSAGSLHHVPVGAQVLAVDAQPMGGLSKAELLKAIGGASGPVTIDFSGTPQVELKNSPYAVGVRNQPLPPPPTRAASSGARAPTADKPEPEPADANRLLYAEEHEQEGKRFLKLHVLPCFV